MRRTKGLVQRRGQHELEGRNKSSSFFVTSSNLRLLR